jgi:hypothetical protein
MGRIALLAWGVTAAFSYVLLGGFLGRLVEGYDRSSLSFLPLLLTGLLVLASVVLTALWTRSRMRAPRDQVRSQPVSGRRRFLLGAVGALSAGAGVVATLGAAMARNSRWFTVSAQHIFLVRPSYQAEVARDEWTGSRVEGYRRLGRTGARVSDISLGSGASTGGRQTVAVVREAIDRGVNYFDTAPDYAAAGSENRFGEAMQGVREQVFLATKFCRPTGHLYPGHSVEDYMEAARWSA